MRWLQEGQKEFPSKSSFFIVYHLLPMITSIVLPPLLDVCNVAPLPIYDWFLRYTVPPTRLVVSVPPHSAPSSVLRYTAYVSLVAMPFRVLILHPPSTTSATYARANYNNTPLLEGKITIVNPGRSSAQPRGADFPAMIPSLCPY
jgi:hypothetical protein